LDWYLDNVGPILREEGVAVLDPYLLFLSRDLPEVYQRLRCRALYHALLFTSEILGLGLNAVERLHAEGPYVALHLSFQDRNVLRSSCVYDSETARMVQEWFATHHMRMQSDSGAASQQKLAGLCPLSPNEVTRILQAC
ncbi:hypothetical protein CLOM_g15698, partial [Closterium sp. NIES-68]